MWTVGEKTNRGLKRGKLRSEKMKCCQRDNMHLKNRKVSEKALKYNAYMVKVSALASPSKAEKSNTEKRRVPGFELIICSHSDKTKKWNINGKFQHGRADDQHQMSEPADIYKCRKVGRNDDVMECCHGAKRTGDEKVNLGEAPEPKKKTLKL